MGISKDNFLTTLLLTLIFLLVYFFVTLISPLQKTYTKDFVYDTASLISPQKIITPPTILKTIYITGWSAGSKKYLTYLDDLLATTQINSVVIDVKDSAGIIFHSADLVKHLHEKGIYVIGRIAVFEDPQLAKMRPDLAVDALWVDPASLEVQDYNIKVAKDALSRGFDEINFDYIRFPSDGDVENMKFPKWDKKIPRNVVIKNFFKKLREALPDVKISADLFGQTTTNTDDMGIGQVWEDALPYFDYLCPMVYPSHYAHGFLGYENPAEHPYEIVKDSIDNALARKEVQEKIKGLTLAKIRPWLQDFSLGATYDATKVEDQIRAVSDAMGADFNGYMLWSASNLYTKDAILK